MRSIYKALGSTIPLPLFKEQRLLYMHKTRMDSVLLPRKFKEFYGVVDSILSKVADHSNVCYITIDSKRVCNETHRRSGIHVDYNWYESAHGEPRPTHNPPPDYPSMGRHSAHRPGKGNHGHRDQLDLNGGMLLVSDYPGCRVFKGNFKGVIKPGGDCSDIDVSGLRSEIMPPNTLYFMNSLCMHEPLIIEGSVDRTLIRINFHPDYIFKLRA